MQLLKYEYIDGGTLHDEVDNLIKNVDEFDKAHEKIKYEIPEQEIINYEEIDVEKIILDTTKYLENLENNTDYSCSSSDSDAVEENTNLDDD